jgi:hypothetical protein
MALAEQVPITAGELLVDQWLQRIEHARKSEAREAFDAVAEVCYSFYKKSAKFMWEDSFRKKFIGDIGKPRFETTINAAFEFVAIFGPYLFWDYPHRQAKAYEPLEIDPELFGADDEQGAMWLAGVQQRQEMQHRRAMQTAALMERYLNYSQREQNLQQHSMSAVYDAIITGRGVLVPRAYQFPGSGRTLTGLFREPVDNLLIDPDCCDPLLEGATWVAIRHTSPNYEVEDRFNLQRGTLADAGNLESYNSVVMNNRPIDKIHRAYGRTNDIIVWYEIWSKCGVAGRSKSCDVELVRELDNVVGDYAYICVAPGVPWPLNAPPAAFHEDVTDDEIAGMLSWPFPCYMDGKWPIALLDFYQDPESCWPVAPLSAGLGHLVCINVLMAAYVEQAYENRKTIIAVLEEYGKEVESKLKSKDNPAVVRLKTDLTTEINKVVQYLNRPNMNTDILGAIEMELRLFQKATGLVDFMYAAEQTQDRSARTTAAKEEKTAIRPEKMSRDVAQWQTNAACLEAMLAALEVQGQDVEPQIPGELWDALITNQDPEQVMREMQFIVEATDIRRPNRERDLQNLQTLAQQAVAAFMEYAGQSGNWEPLNNFFAATFKAMEVPFSGMRMEPFQPQPDPELQQKQEIEQQKLQGDLAKTKADIEAKLVDLETKMMLAELKARESQQKLLLDAVSHQQEMEQDQQRHALDMRMQAATAAQGLMVSRAQGEEKIRSQREMAKAKVAAARKPSMNGRK